MKSMTMVARAIAFTLFLLQGPLCAAEVTVPLDTIVIQLRSHSDSESGELLDEVLQLTSRFLNDYFGAYYAKTEPEDYFEEVRISANTFGVQGTSSSFITTIEFDGDLAFYSEPVPSTSFLTSILKNAFKGLNLDLYLKNLGSSDDSFLNDLTHAFIEVAGVSVADTTFQELPSASHTDNINEKFELEDWAEIAIYATAGVVGAVVLLALTCLCRCWFGNGQVQDAADVIKVKKIEFPSPVAQPEKPKNQQKKEIVHGGRKGQKARDRSVSPMRSIVSQDSSMFTYNPTGMSRDLGTLSLGSISNIHISTPNFDLEAWQRPNIISSKAPAPFGQDISAIEQKDHLSLIEEEEDDGILQTRGSQRQTKKKKSSSRDKRSSGSRHYSTNVYTTTIPDPYGREYSTEDSFSSSSDVINDLKNLSAQIDQHRLRTCLG